MRAKLRKINGIDKPLLFITYGNIIEKTPTRLLQFMKEFPFSV